MRARALQSPPLTVFLLWSLCCSAACGDDDAGGSDGAEGLGSTAADAGADAGASLPEHLVVALADGLVGGEMTGDGARRFLQIPYAQPPVGELRWKAPRQNAPWEGLRHETGFVEGCPQLADQGAPAAMNEDCLYLNVWSPQPAPSHAPVMVWIHGGGNFSGAAGIPIPTTTDLWYDGRVFAAEQGVVLVTLNYRLGPLGFMAHAGLADEEEPLGNQGLLDQRMALRWVQRNIAAFGGDPGNVTIFGESAGAADVCYHVASPGSDGLFHRAISQSGGCTIRSSGRELEASGAAEPMAAFGAALGCPPGDDQLACMREAAVEDLLDQAMQPAPGSGDVEQTQWRFAVVIDGDGGFLPEAPRALFERGAIADVPYLLGANHDEGTTFVWTADSLTSEEAYLADLELRFGEHAAEVAALYPADAFDGDYDAARARAIGDSSLVCGTHDTARLAAAAGRDVFLYDFDVWWALSPELFRAGHAAEISHAFGLPLLREPDPASEQVAEAMNAYWARFAETGDPNGPGAPAQWPAFQVEDDRRLQLAPGFAVLRDFRAQECAFWRRYHGVE